MNKRQWDRLEQLNKKLTDLAMEFENVGLKAPAELLWEAKDKINSMEGQKLTKTTGWKPREHGPSTPVEAP